MLASLVRAALCCLVFAWPPGLVLAAPIGEPPLRAWNHFEEELGAHFQNFRVLPLAGGDVVVGNGSGVLRFDGERWAYAPTPQGARVRDLWQEADGRVLYASIDDFGEVVTDAAGRLRLDSWRERLPLPMQALGDVFDITRLDGDLLLQDSRQLVVVGGDDVRQLPAHGGFQVGRLCQGRYLINERERGLLVLSADRRTLEPVPGAERFRGDLWMGCLERPDGSLLFGWSEEGLHRLDPDGSWTHLEGVASDWLAAHRGLEMAALGDGGIALVGVGGGALVLDAELHPLFRLDRSSGLPSDTQVNAAAAPDGRLWLAGEGGVSVLSWPGPLSAFGERFGITPVMSLVQHAGHLLAAGQRGVHRLTPGQGAPQRLQALPDQVWRMLEVDGDLLLAGAGGVYRTRLDTAGQPQPVERLLTARFALDLLVVGDSALAASNDGLHRFTLSGAAPPVRLPGSDGEWTHLALADDGSIWAGSSQQRVARVAPDDVVTQFAAESGLPPGDTRPYRVADRLWVATPSGLLEPTPEGLFVCARGLPADLCEADVHRLLAIEAERFLLHADGRLMEAAMRGDGVLDRRPVALAPWHRFPPADALREADGTLWLATNHALLRLAPHADAAAGTLAPRVVALETAGDRIVLDPQGERDLPAETRTLRFEFAWHGDPLAGPFEYRSWAEGHEPQWTAWRREAQRELTGLRSGDFRLHLQARDANGRLGGEAQYAFVIATPWYAGTWAWIGWTLGALIVLGLAMHGLLRLRTARLVARTRELETAVAQRTRELAERSEQVVEQNRRLEALDQARTRFFAGVSHEFRTPLSLILGPLRALRRGDVGRVPAPVAAELRVVERNAAELATLVDQILELNRSTAQGLALQRKPLDLAALVRHVVSLFESLATNQHRTLSLHGAEEPLWVMADSTRLQQALVNLLGNAFKYSPPGTPLEVLLESDRGGSGISVLDRGAGIPEADLPHVFELYYRGHAERQQSVGSGIGLALVRAVAEAHGGQVEVAARDGAGSRFALRLPDSLRCPPPAASVEASGAGAAGAPAAELAEAGLLAPFRSLELDAGDTAAADDLPCVLLADDNAELRGFVARRLALHYRVLQAGDGAAALGRAREALPDVIISDWRMPGMDGMALLAAVRADSELDGVGFIMVAGPQDVEDATTALTAGVDDYLAKPFDSDELLARIAGLLRARRRFEQRPPIEPPTPAPSEPPVLAAARAQVVAHLDQADFGVAELAAALHMDRSALFRKFKQLEAGTPVEFIRGVRLAAARERLLSGEGSVSEIAYACGFESLSWFSRCFRDVYGTPPGELRQRGRRPRGEPV